MATFDLILVSVLLLSGLIHLLGASLDWARSITLSIGGLLLGLSAMAFGAVLIFMPLAGFAVSDALILSLALAVLVFSIFTSIMDIKVSKK